MSPGAGRDSRRTFSRAEVRRVWERQGRVCALYGRAIPFDLMHGDHIHPWIAGGPTVFENWQALCGSCNLRKGSQPQAVAKQQFQIDRLTAGTAPLRAWQIEALDAVLPRILSQPVLVEACPGAGKTHFGLEMAYRLLSSGDKVVSSSSFPRSESATAGWRARPARRRQRRRSPCAAPVRGVPSTPLVTSTRALSSPTKDCSSPPT